jgi:transposase
MLSGVRAEEVCRRFGLSKRSLQRWLRKARQEGSIALAENRGREPRLSPRQRERLRQELELPPREFGVSGEQWSGGALSRHLDRHYGISIGPRQCRNLILQLGSDTTRTGQRRPSDKAIDHHRKQKIQEPEPALVHFVRSDWERKRIALRKIQRLASSGMPVLPFAYTLFDISGAAIDQDTTTADPATGICDTFGSWLFKNPDPKWLSILKEVVAPSAGKSGLISPQALYSSARTVLIHNDLLLPGYEKSSAWNEFFRPACVEQGMIGVLRDCDQFVGILSIARSALMKPWSKADIDFVRGGSGAHSAWL